MKNYTTTNLTSVNIQKSVCASEKRKKKTRTKWTPEEKEKFAELQERKMLISP